MMVINMKITQILNKINQLNKLNKELGINRNYYLLIYETNSASRRIYNADDLNRYCSNYIDSIQDKLNNSNFTYNDIYDEFYLDIKANDKIFDDVTFSLVIIEV